MPESRTHQRFRSRNEQLETFLEAMDAAARITFNILGRRQNQGIQIDAALPINCSNYKRLNHPTNHRARIYNYCRSRNMKASIVDLFSQFSEYLRDILKEIYATNPMLVVGKSTRPLQMNYSEIARFGNLKEIHEKLVEDTFRDLENQRSTARLLSKILQGTGANITNAEKDSALRYLELRHLIIHNNSKIDDTFAQNYGAYLGVSAGDRVPSTFSVASDAILSVNTLVGRIDREFIRLGLVAPI